VTTFTATLGGQPVTIHHGGSTFGALTLPILLGLDVESTYMTDRGQFDPDFMVRLAQFGTEDEAWVLDLQDVAQREAAEYMLSEPQVTFASHTPMDVLAVWRGLGIDITHRNVDTRMLAIQADPDKDDDRDLKTLATKYGMPELEQADAELHAWMVDRWVAGGGRKNAKRSDIEEAGWNALATMPAEEWPEVFVRYAGLDAIAVRRLAPLLTAATQNPPEVIRIDQWCSVRANRQQIAGKRIDVDALKALHDEATSVTGEAKSKAEELTGGVNINGPKILDWLAGQGVNWDTWEGARTPKGMPSLAGDNLKLLADMAMLEPVFYEVVGLMQQQKGHLDLLRKTDDITRRLVLHDDGIHRIHPQLNPIGASTTARMSSSGPNVQNFSKRDPRMRGLFLPEPGHTFVTCDFAQIELRVVAALAREDKMIETILAGGDLHQLTVDELAEAGVTITRDQAKIVNFLIVYGGGASALWQQTGIPLDEAQNIIRAWRDRYPSISALSMYLGMEREAIRTISNRRLPVTRVKGRGANAGDIRSYANINYAVQSAAREVLVDAWIRLEDGHNRPGVVWLPVHDELVLQVPDAEVEAVIADVEDSMRMHFRGVPVEADAIVLRDEDGVSRWMTGKLAEKIAKEAAA